MNKNPKLLNHKLLLSLAGIIVLAGIIRLFSFSTLTPDDDEQFQRKFNQNYRIYSLNIPPDLRFANEEVPVQQLDVKEKLDRELLVNTYWQSQTLLFLKRSHRWFPVIEPILKEQGVPDDFKYIALIESGFTNVVSPAGATGFWQFMKPSAERFGLQVDEEIDERYHIEKATVAACKYLKEAKKKFGSWTLAAASYNMGMNGLEKQLARQKVNNYYDLLLNEETSRYLFRAIAVKEIMNDPSRYGFTLREKDLYPTLDWNTVRVDSNVTDFAEFAFTHNINYKLLKYYNPWLRQSYLTNKEGKTYLIKIPKDENYIPEEIQEVEDSLTSPVAPEPDSEGDTLNQLPDTLGKDGEENS